MSARYRVAVPDALLPTLIIAVVAILLALAELITPARPAVRNRWPLNLTLGALGLALGAGIGLLIPLGGSLWAERHHIGLIRWLDLGPAVAVPLAVVLLDMSIYWQHRLFHIIPLIWPLHRTHHRDEAMDVTTGVRFNPGEAVLSAFYKAAVVVALGASPLAVLIFQTILGVASLWEHANLQLPPRFDRALRHVLVTPAMHLVHHGRDGDDMRTNYGFSTSLWDRLFRSYRRLPTSDRLGAE